MIECPNCKALGRCFHIGVTGSSILRCAECKFQFLHKTPTIKPPSLRWIEAREIVANVEGDDDEP